MGCLRTHNSHRDRAVLSYPAECRTAAHADLLELLCELKGWCRARGRGKIKPFLSNANSSSSLYNSLKFPRQEVESSHGSGTGLASTGHFLIESSSLQKWNAAVLKKDVGEKYSTDMLHESKSPGHYTSQYLACWSKRAGPTCIVNY